MRTSSHTLIDPKGYIRVTIEYQLTPTEKRTLVAIANCLCHWEKKRPYVEIRHCGDKRDESKTVTAKACHALHEAGLLVSDPMAMHGYQFTITELGRQMAAKLSA